MGWFIAAWAVLAIALTAYVARSRTEGGALTLAYFFGASLIHVPGMLPYYLDDSYPSTRFSDTFLGFQATVLALLVYSCGAVASRVIAHRTRHATRAKIDVVWLNGLGWRFVIGGLVVFLLALPVAALAPSMTSIISSFVGLLVVGMWLRFYSAELTGNRRQLMASFLVMPLLPLATLLSGGFIGFGVHWVLSAVLFYFVVAKRRRTFVLLTPLVVYIGLSVFVTYMGERSAIREVVWNQQATIGDRIERISAIGTNFQLLNLGDFAQETSLDDRLNQNYLVGVAINAHQDGLVPLAYGGTVPWWIFIPRLVWPDKPGIGGGGSLVEEATGIGFAEGTSVGAGQVLESYVNFGWLGIVVGFFGLGFLFMTLDRRMMDALTRSDVRGFLANAMPGLALLQPGGNLAEILVSTIAAIIATYLVFLVDSKLSAYTSQLALRASRHWTA